MIPLEPLWKEYRRIIKDNAAIVLTAVQPFTSQLVMSNLSMFKNTWVWEKSKAANYVNARVLPLKYHEDVLIFGKKKTIYNPQMRTGFKPYHHVQMERYDKTKCVFHDTRKAGMISKSDGDRFPSTVLKIHNSNYKSKHPTQKPVELFEYFIKTYTNEGMTVLDNTAGVFTTAIACINTNRNYIVIEMDKGYFDIGIQRINDTIKELNNKVI